MLSSRSLLPLVSLSFGLACLAMVGCASTGGSGGGDLPVDAGSQQTDTGAAQTDTGGQAGTDAGAQTTDSGPQTSDWTIEKLQKSVDETACAAAPGGFLNGPKGVVLNDVVVATPPLNKVDSKKTLDGIFLQTKGGGPWNGLYVVGPADSDIANLKAGDVVSVTGDVLDYYCLTEFKATAISVKGTELPVAVTVTLDQLGVHAKPEDNESLESVLVNMGAVVVSDPEPKSTKGTKFCGFWVGKDADDKALLVVCTWGTSFATYDKDAKTWNTTVKKGDKIKSLRGAVQFSFDEFKLAPLGDAGIEWDK